MAPVQAGRGAAESGTMTAPRLDFGEVETFLDRHPELLEDYLMRKGKQEMVEKWMRRRGQGQGAAGQIGRAHV